MDPQASLVYSSRMTSLFKMPQWFHVAHHQESACSQYSFPRADITKVHTLGVLKQQKYIFLTVLEARSPKSVSQDQNEGVGRVMFPPEVFGEKVFPVVCGSLKKASSVMCSCITPVSAFQTTWPPPLPFVLKSPSACS